MSLKLRGGEVTLSLKGSQACLWATRSKATGWPCPLHDFFSDFLTSGGGSHLFWFFYLGCWSCFPGTRSLRGQGLCIMWWLHLFQSVAMVLFHCLGGQPPEMQGSMESAYCDFYLRGYGKRHSHSWWFPSDLFFNLLHSLSVFSIFTSLQKCHSSLSWFFPSSPTFILPYSLILDVFHLIFSFTAYVPQQKFSSNIKITMWLHSIFQVNDYNEYKF